MTSGTDQSTNRQWAEDVSPLCDVREYEMSHRTIPCGATMGQSERCDGYYLCAACREVSALRQRNAELLKALGDLLNVIAADELIPESVSYMKQARAAAAKARGETQ